MLGQDLRDGVGELVFVGIGPLAQRFNLLEFLPPKLINVLVECQCVPLFRGFLRRDYRNPQA